MLSLIGEKRQKEKLMKKLFLFAAILGSVTILPSVSNAAVNSNNAAREQVVYANAVQPMLIRNRRSVIRTRIVWRYGRRYRETYRITYRRNGTTGIQIISRVLLPGRVYRNY
jgi:hypothetical protein